MQSKERIVIAYVPVLHSGYVRFFKDYPFDTYLIGSEIIEDLSRDIPYFGRDIRAVESSRMCSVVGSLDILPSIKELSLRAVEDLLSQEVSIVAPDEDITREVLARYFSRVDNKLVSVFLRWDRKITEQEYVINPDHKVSLGDFDSRLASLAQGEAQRSSDWWRQVGAVLVKDNKILFQDHNRHLPDAHNPYALGDPKNNYDVGEGPNYYTSIHAEAAVIASAAREGIPLKGSSLYVTTFPCPACARLVCYSGISRVYYSAGHSALDTESILKEAGIELIYVPLR